MKIAALLLFTTFSLSAFAINVPNEICQLSGEIQLTRPTTIMCTKNLEIKEGTRILTNGFPLQILVNGNVQFGSLAQGVSIHSFAAGDRAGMDASTIYVYARTASGNLHINNRGSSALAESGDVTLEYMSIAAYDQDISVSPDSNVDISLNNRRRYEITAPNYKLKSK